jgi:hypothetical protein
MMRLAMAAAALVIAAAPAQEHGGKIKWTEPKNAKEFDVLIAQAAQAGRASIIFFTMDG